MKNYAAKNHIKKWKNILQYANKESGYAEQLSYMESVTPEDKQKLLEIFPDTPLELIEILNEMDGTYYRNYTSGHVLIPFFTSDIMEMGYYLLSARQITESSSAFYRSINDIYGEETIRKYNVAGPGIDPAAPFSKRLHFADCVNNGGSSRLYVDFAPADGGVYGQIVRFIHDPDEYAVIAESFEDFLEKTVTGWLAASIYEFYGLEGAHIVLEGRFEHKVKVIKDILAIFGATVESKVTDETDILVIGSHPDKKVLALAEQNAADIVSEDDFIEEYLFGFNINTDI